MLIFSLRSGLVFDDESGAFYTHRPYSGNILRPPSNCHMCSKDNDDDLARNSRSLHSTDNPNVLLGISYKGSSYHYNDFVVIQDKGKSVGSIGQIKKMHMESQYCRLVVRLFGRVNDIRDTICPDELKDEVQ